MAARKAFTVNESDIKNETNLPKAILFKVKGTNRTFNATATATIKGEIVFSGMLQVPFGFQGRYLFPDQLTHERHRPEEIAERGLCAVCAALGAGMEQGIIFCSPECQEQYFRKDEKPEVDVFKDKDVPPYFREEAE